MSTHIYILLNFICGCLGCFIRFCYLAWGDYPRTQSVTRPVELGVFLLLLYFTVWAWWLL